MQGKITYKKMIVIHDLELINKQNEWMNEWKNGRII